MRGSRVAALALVALVAMAVMGLAAAEPSGGCTGGPVNPGDTPAGIGVHQSGDPTTGTGTLRFCNTGAVIPPPGKGALTLSGDANNTKGYIDLDGDSNNAGAPCTDGYFRVAVDANGPHFYDAPNGGWSSSQGEKTPDQFAGDLATNCAPA